jgi:hypothetical protein
MINDQMLRLKQLQAELKKTEASAQKLQRRLDAIKNRKLGGQK